MTPNPTAGHPPLVLVANDQEWPARSLESLLSPNGFAVLRARSGRQALERARSSRLDAIFVDADLVDIDATTLIRALRAEPAVPASTPILLTTTGPATRQQRIDALKAGAWDVLGLPIDLDDLLARLANYTAAKLDADHARDANHLDGPTGLYNLRGLLLRARELGADAIRFGRPLACLVLASHGDQEEDDDEETATRIAHTLRATSRASDAIARLGPREFVILAPGTDADGARAMARRLTTTLTPDPQTQQATRTPRLRAAYFGTRNFRDAAIDPVDLLIRATHALRRFQTDHDPDPVRPFELEPAIPA